MGVCAVVAATDFNAEDFKTRYDAGEFEFVIAVDSGLKHLEALEVAPDLAIGDFDSLGYVPRCKRVSRYPSDKDQSDMELALMKARNWRFDTLYVYGGIGGRLDHTLANLQLFAQYSELDMSVMAIADTYAIATLTGPDVLDLPAFKKGTVSVFAASDVAQGVIERGMRWSIDDESLTNRTTRGLSNELMGEPALVAVESGTLFVFFPLLDESEDEVS